MEEDQDHMSRLWYRLQARRGLLLVCSGQSCHMVFSCCDPESRQPCESAGTGPCLVSDAGPTLGKCAEGTAQTRLQQQVSGAGTNPVVSRAN